MAHSPQGDPGEDIEILAKALGDRQVVMAPPGLTELLSDPELSAPVAGNLSDVPLIESEPGYSQRAGKLRDRVLAQKRKARLTDALIAQSCIDARVSLISRDRDFRAFAQAAGLDLVVG